jgi:hypothetical protein
MMKRPDLHLRMHESGKGVHRTPLEFVVFSVGEFPRSISDARDGSPDCGSGRLP